MAGSPAEERIRAKVEAALRREFPTARIIHELNMSWGGIRLDVGAVRPEALTLVEIKSERDVLKRLRDQVSAALRVTGDVRLYVTEKHRAALLNALSSSLKDSAGLVIYDWVEKPGGGKAGYTRPNPDYIDELRRVRIMVETDDGFADLDPYQGAHWLRDVMEHTADPRAQLELLWADELRDLMARHRVGTTPKATREINKRLALEHLTGRQIREGVCNALRGRPFARADEAAA